jgi:hypothetical protein
MATVSSQPGGMKGYRLYLDGRLVGEVEEGRSYTTPTGFPIPVSSDREEAGHKKAGRAGMMQL